MASRSVGVGWFVVGFLAGVGATLAAIIFATRPQPMHVALPAPVAPASAVVTYHAPQLPQTSAPALAGSATTASPAQAPPAGQSRPSPPDEQTQEDAAAAGMTSRSHPGG